LERGGGATDGGRVGVENWGGIRTSLIKILSDV